MKSLFFLSACTFKNSLKQMVKKPGMLILYGFLLFFVVMSFWSMASPSEIPGMDGVQDISWLKLFYLGYMLMICFSTVYAGFSTGSAIFDMPDVNFLFVSPVSAKKVLVYGLLKQAVKSFASALFILMMGSMLKSNWNMGIRELLILFGGYLFLIFTMQILAVCIYMITSAYPKIKTPLKAVFFAFLVPVGLYFVWQVVSGTPIARAVLNTVNSAIMYSIPVAGWLNLSTFGFISGSMAAALPGLLLTILFFAACILYIMFGKTDYFEDVLVATEKVFMRQQAIKDGDLDAASNTRKVRLKNKDASGKIWGIGASAFLGKHLVEISRKNRFKILDAGSVSYIVISVVMAFSSKDADAGSFIPLLATTMLMRSFFVGTGLGLRELYHHYIFMIPESSFSKIFWSNLELVVKCFAESLIGMVIAGIILKATVPEILIYILVTTVFSLLLISINLLSMRMFSSVISQGLLLTFYFLFVILVMVPGVVAGAILGMSIGGSIGVIAGIGLLTLWELLLSVLFFFLSKGVLDTCDMEVMPQSRK